MNLFVCENYYPEFERSCDERGLTDVAVIPFPSTCLDKSRKAEAARLFAESVADGDQGVVLCSKDCNSCNLIPQESTLDVHPANYCFSHLASESFINYVLAKGGYIIGSGWLKSWRQRIADAGFDQETARHFYHDFCTELVFFDAGIEPEAEKNMTELSCFLELPYVVVPIKLDSTQLTIDQVLSERRLHATNSDNSQAIAEIQAQCAEYAAIFDLMGRISSYSNKRDAIEKVKEIFVMVFGAQQFKYWNNDYGNDSLPEDIKAFLLDGEREFILFKEDDRFCIKIKWHEKLFGAIDISGFLFPEYIVKYLNFALEIVKICGLVFSNNEQYEKILKSEQEMRYSGTHDALTDLHNRSYMNEILNQHIQATPFTVFMFDIDRLKFVNDHYGHAEGDKLIRSVAAILKKCFRETDIVARIGGDEFVAIVQETSLESADIITSRINQQIESHNRNRQDIHLKISFSIGYAVSKTPEDTIETIMKNADELMYIDKASKRRL